MGKREKKFYESEMASDIRYYEIEPLSKANLSNNFLFVKVMSDSEILRSFLEIVLKIKIRKLKLIEYEKTLLPDMYARGIRMDIYMRMTERMAVKERCIMLKCSSAMNII